MTMIKALSLAATLLACFVLPIHGQPPDVWNPQGLTMERAELERLLDDLGQIANSGGYSGRIRDGAERDAELIQGRLNEGDFRLGDQIRLTVTGESGIPPTLPVEPGPRITLPTIGAIPLNGVLRSELELHLTRELSRFIQAPMVQATSEIRVSIQGAVGAPGFYTAPADMLISEALMLAGGPGQTAALEEIRIERAGDVLWDGSEVRDLLTEGRTLDQLNLRGGDQIFLPPQTGNFWNSTWGNVARWTLAGVSTAVFGYRIFRN